MKFRNLIFAILINLQIVACSSNKEDLNQIWIAVHSKSLNQGFAFDFTGMILDLSQHEGVISNCINNDFIEKFDYQHKNNKLYIKDSLFAEVVTLTKDSLVLLIDSTEVEFKPIIKSYSTISDLKFDDNTWYYKNELFEGPIYFYNKCIFDSIYSGFQFIDAEMHPDYFTNRWKLDKYKKSVTLMLYGGFERVFVNQIDSVIGNRIFMISYFDGKSYKSQLKKLEQDKNWELFYSLLLKNRWYTDSISIDCDEIPGFLMKPESPIIFIKDIKQKKLNLEFGKGILKIFVGSKLVDEGKWTITSDLKFIIFDDCKGKDNFFRIKMFDEKVLELEIVDDFGSKITNESFFELQTKNCKLNIKFTNR